MKPKTSVEKAMDKEITWEQIPSRPPHCDARILHLPEECKFCADAKELQEEREKLGISNTGHANRAWPCPADKARSSQSLNGWHGNRAYTEEAWDERWKKFREEFEKFDKEFASVAELEDASVSKTDE